MRDLTDEVVQWASTGRGPRESDLSASRVREEKRGCAWVKFSSACERRGQNSLSVVEKGWTSHTFVPKSDLYPRLCVNSFGIDMVSIL